MKKISDFRVVGAIFCFALTILLYAVFFALPIEIKDKNYQTFIRKEKVLFRYPYTEEVSYRSMNSSSGVYIVAIRTLWLPKNMNEIVLSYAKKYVELEYGKVEIKKYYEGMEKIGRYNALRYGYKVYDYDDKKFVAYMSNLIYFSNKELAYIVVFYFYPQERSDIVLPILKIVDEMGEW